MGNFFFIKETLSTASWLNAANQWKAPYVPPLTAYARTNSSTSSLVKFLLLPTTGQKFVRNSLSFPATSWLDGAKPKKPNHHAIPLTWLQTGSTPGNNASINASFFTSSGYCAAYA